jgi:hypothetical protein
MVVIVHQAIGVTNPVVTCVHIGKEIEETLPVSITQEDGSLLISSAGEVIHRSREFNS